MLFVDSIRPIADGINNFTSKFKNFREKLRSTESKLIDIFNSTKAAKTYFESIKNVDTGTSFTVEELYYQLTGKLKLTLLSQSEIDISKSLLRSFAKRNRVNTLIKDIESNNTELVQRYAKIASSKISLIGSTPEDIIEKYLFLQIIVNYIKKTGKLDLINKLPNRDYFQAVMVD